MPTQPYDEEFKRNCVDLLLKSGKPLKPMAREMAAEIRQLRKELDRVTRQREILKKP
jgi:transposase-like protein